jgi:4-methyl-5(b-hydroxyethyl)-thiazole monophosphate biosynthesis
MISADKIAAAICAAPMVFEKAGILNNIRVTSYPGVLSPGHDYIYSEDDVVRDGNIITGRGAGSAASFTFELLKAFGYSDQADHLRKSMQYHP